MKTKRPLVSVLVLMAFLLAGIGLPGRVETASAGTRPNIVMLVLDDQDVTVSPFWDAMPIVRDRIRNQGLTFTNAFAPTPICCPARATLWTGLYGHNTGVLSNGGDYGGWQAFIRPLDANGNPTGVNNEERSLPVYLKNIGYRTAMVGKYLNGIETDPTHVPPGWTEYFGNADNLIYTGYGYTLNEYVEGGKRGLVSYGTAETDYSTDVFRKKAVEFLGRSAASPSAPIFLMLTPTAPHLPLPPAPRHRQKAAQWAGKLPHAPNYGEEDLSDKPSWLRLSGDARARIQSYADYEYPNRMGSLLAVDEMMDEIIRVLQSQGRLENTIFIVISDNGYNQGSHRLIHKMAPYEESIRVPLVISGPGVRRGQSAAMVTESDLAPTILQLSGVGVPAHMDGKSLLPLLASESGAAAHRQDLVAQYLGGSAANGIGPELPSYLYGVLGIDIPSYKAIRNHRYKYVKWYEGTVNEIELYDLSTDPYEMRNLASSPAGRLQYGALIKQMDTRLRELSVCSGQSCR
jgi:N-acetylglucosamine-6-sulfatase